MTVITWHPVGKVDPHDLGEARQQVHNVAQWLVRIVRALSAGTVREITTRDCQSKSA